VAPGFLDVSAAPRRVLPLARSWFVCLAARWSRSSRSVRSVRSQLRAASCATRWSVGAGSHSAVRLYVRCRWAPSCLPHHEQPEHRGNITATRATATTDKRTHRNSARSAAPRYWISSFLNEGKHERERHRHRHVQGVQQSATQPPTDQRVAHDARRSFASATNDDGSSGSSGAARHTTPRSSGKGKHGEVQR